MPMYSYRCAGCEKLFEHIQAYHERDNAPRCTCGGKLIRAAVEGFTPGKSVYQMQAVLKNGQHIAGHFGKDAVRKKDA